MHASPAILALVAVLAVAASSTPLGNMNGRYGVANMPGLNVSLPERSKGKYFDVYGPQIESLYSQVNWKMHLVDLPGDIVKAWNGRVMNIVGYEFDIVQAKDASKPCISSSSDNPIPCARTSVPGWSQYNHHYGNSLESKSTHLVRTDIPDVNGGMSSHTGLPAGWKHISDPEAVRTAPGPLSQRLPMGNGAESRLTLHYFPVGYGAQVYSPSTSTVNAMIIDTHNRDPHAAVPGRHGPVPERSNVGPDAMYSGLMECPCTDLYPKRVASASTQDTGTCGAHLFSGAEDCFGAAVSLGLTAKTNRTLSSTSEPAGCSVTAVTDGFDVVFNTNNASTQPCGATNSTGRVVGKSSEDSVVKVAVDMKPAPLPVSADITGDWQIAGPFHTGSLVSITPAASGNYTLTCSGSGCFPPRSAFVNKDNQLITYNLPGAIRADKNQITWSNGFTLNRWFPVAAASTQLAGTWKITTANPKTKAEALIGHTILISGPNTALTVQCLGTGCFGIGKGALVNNTLTAYPSNLATASADRNTLTFRTGLVFRRVESFAENGTIEITMAGPSDVWIGAGFRAQLPVPTPGSGSASAMNGTWAVVVLGNGTVMERLLGQHTAGIVLQPSVTVVSNTVAGSVRTVTLTRPLRGLTEHHFTFVPTAHSFGLIDAVGYGPDFAQHKLHAMQAVYLVGADAPTCVCDLLPPLGSTSSQGTIGPFSFNSRCEFRPLGEMLSDPVWDNSTTPYTDDGGVNPTCKIQAYRGGLKCCKDGTLLTDGAENRSALVAENNTYHYQVMYRYYYEDAATVANLTETVISHWWTEHDNGEHDIPPCYSDDCIDKITSNFTGKDVTGVPAGKSWYFVHLEGHCHIGCQGMELWIMGEAGRPHQEPELLCRTQVDYGAGDEPHNEVMGYILGNQPCIFGPGFGPIREITPDTQLMSVKYQNNTHARYGDMALWEIRLAVVP